MVSFRMIQEAIKEMTGQIDPRAIIKMIRSFQQKIRKINREFNLQSLSTQRKDYQKERTAIKMKTLNNNNKRFCNQKIKTEMCKIRKEQKLKILRMKKEDRNQQNQKFIVMNTKNTKSFNKSSIIWNKR